MTTQQARIAFNIALALSILYLPWWVGTLIAIAGAFLIENFYEIVFYGICSDALYGNVFGWHDLQYVGTLFTFILFLISSFVRGKLAW